MVRQDDDTWDIATSVGATAVMVAMARAAETGRANPLIRDPFAEPLVAAPQLSETRAQVLSQPALSFPRLVDYLAVRTHFFDAFFTAAAEAGISQHVILAAGLDSRAYRMHWPTDTVIYEVDLPAVLEYKSATLDAFGATPATNRREIGVDLRHNWPAALSAAGFDPTRSTTWLAEGLLPFLPSEAQEALFTHIDRLSTAGSRVAVEVFDYDDAEQHQRLLAAGAKPSDDNAIDPFELWYDHGGRPDCAKWFDSRGWTTQSVYSRQEAQRLDRNVSEGDAKEAPIDPFDSIFVTAEKNTCR